MAIRGGAGVRRVGIAGWMENGLQRIFSQGALLSPVPVCKFVFHYFFIKISGKFIKIPLIFIKFPLFAYLVSHILGHVESCRSISLEAYISRGYLIATPWLQWIMKLWIVGIKKGNFYTGLYVVWVNLISLS